MSNIIRKSVVIATLFFTVIVAYQPQQFFLSRQGGPSALTYWDAEHHIEIIQTIEQLQLSALSQDVPLIICFEAVDSPSAQETKEQLQLLVREYAHEQLKIVVIDPSRNTELARDLRSLMLPPDFPIAEPMYIFIYKKEVLLPALSGRYDTEDLRTFIDYRFDHYGLQQRPGVVGFLGAVFSRMREWVSEHVLSYFW